MGLGTRDVALLERGRELGVVRRALEAAEAGRGGMVVVEGPAGIGKTAVLGAARDLAAAAGMRVLRARGAELERDFAFGVARQAFERALAEADADDRARALEGAAGLAGRLLALPGAAAELAGAPAGSDPSFAVLHGLYWLCANLAAERPLCLLVDDAHWADAASLRYLAFLAPRLEELRVAVVVGARPGEPGPGAELLRALAADPATLLVQPGALSGEGVAQLLGEGLGRDPDERFARACHRATGGNPFLVGQLVMSLREDAVAPTAAAAAHVEGLGARWVGRWILTRLGRLPAPAGRLARAVSVLEEAELIEAAGLAEMSYDEAADAADLLASAEILTPDRPLAFVHPVVRAGVYAEIRSADRSRWHRRAARLLDEGGATAERVVEHLLAAEPAGDAWVVERLAAAARAAARSGAPESAAAFLRRALAEPPGPERRAALLLALGVAEDNSGHEAAIADLEASVAEAVEPRERAEAAVVLGHALARDNRFAEALAVLDAAAAAGAAEGEGPPLEDLAASIATFSVATAEAHAARIRAARERVEAEAEPTRERLALAGQLAVRANEPAAVGAALARRALAAGPSPFPELTDLPWLHQAAVTLLWAELGEELGALLEGAVATARATGDAGLLTGALAYRGWRAVRCGDLAAAESDARAALEDRSLPAPAMYRLRSTAVLVEVLVEAGRLDEAEAAVAPAAAAAAEPTTIAATLRVARGRMWMAQGRAEEALEDLLGAGEIATRTGLICPGCLAWRSEAALALLRLGDRSRARGLADEEVGLARAFGAPRALGVALRAAGLARGGAPGEALLREAAGVLAPSGARLEVARTGVDLGAQLRRANRRAEARGVLGPALDGAHRLGAVPLAERAETELRATGARPRRVQLTGLESLTASERRVAELAAEGLTNREIAQALFVTARTVEGHLTHVFQKLSVRSREDLPTALAA